MEKEIIVVVKYPNEEAYVTKIENTLAALQKLVKGYIEVVTFHDCALVCNEEGRILRMPPNCKFRGIDFFGPVVVLGTRGDEFVSLMGAGRIAIELNNGSYE